MKTTSLVAILLLFAGSLSACSGSGEITVDQEDIARALGEAKKDKVSVPAERLQATLGKAGCVIVFAGDTVRADPHVIVAGDTTPANDAARYFDGLAASDRKAIEDAVLARAGQSFICVGSRSEKRVCRKKMRISYGSGHLSKLNKDVFIIQSERFCDSD